MAEKNYDPFKVNFSTGDNLEAENTSNQTDIFPELNDVEDQNAHLSKRELRIRKKRKKEIKKAADRKFEREAGLTGVKAASLTLGIIGFLLAVSPIALYAGAIIFLLAMALLTVALVLFFIAGFIFIFPFYISAHHSLSGYFNTAVAPVNFASKIVNTLAAVNGVLTTTLSSVGLAMQIAALILLFVAYKALCRKNKIKRTVFLVIGIIISAVILFFGLMNI